MQGVSLPHYKRGETSVYSLIIPPRSHAYGLLSRWIIHQINLNIYLDTCVVYWDIVLYRAAAQLCSQGLLSLSANYQRQ